MTDFYDLKQAVCNAPVYPTRSDLWHRYLEDMGPEDVCLEFGVWRGSSINYMASIRPQHTFYGFDSFEGLPVAWRPSHLAGHFRVTDRSALKFLPNVRLEEGLFEKTLPGFVERATASEMRITRIHVDCDIYSSTTCVLLRLAGIIKKHRPLILFDEFHNYPGFEDHEFKAFLEFINRTGMAFEVVGQNGREPQCLITVK